MFNLQPKRLVKLQPHARTRSRGVLRCGMNVTPKRMSAPRRIVPGGTGLLLDIIRELSLTANLNFVLDAADRRSYDGSSQTWTDATGQGNNFFLGIDGTATATDPTFVGTAGKADEGTYFSFDGGDYFTETAAHTFADAWHKDNGAFSIVCVYYPIAVAPFTVFSNTPTGLTDGITLESEGGAVLQMHHATTNLAFETVSTTPSVTTSSAWNFGGVSFLESGPTSNMRINGNALAPATAASTCTDNNSQPMRIGAYGDATNPNASGSRIACVAGWATNIGATALNNIYTFLKSRRFPSLP